MGFEHKDDLFSSDEIGFEVDDEINLEDGELTGLPTVKAPKRSARERVEVKQGIRRDRLGRPDTEDSDGDLVAPVKGVRLSGSGSASMHSFSKPMLSESSEFGYLFSDDEPLDAHMNEENAGRLAALAYDERQDGEGEQYADIFEKSDQSMVRRKSFNKRSSSASSQPASAAGDTEPAAKTGEGGIASRFSRRSRADSGKVAEPAVCKPELVTIPEPAPEPSPEPEPAPYEPTAYDTPEQQYSEAPQVYGAYPQYPMQYPQYPVPYPQYPYPPQGYPQVPYPPQSGYPQVPYPPYMPMPYTAPVVVLPPMGYYYDPYDEEGMPEPRPYGRRRRRAPRDADLSGRYEDPAPQAATERYAPSPEPAPAPEPKPERFVPAPAPEPEPERFVPTPAPEPVAPMQPSYGPTLPVEPEPERNDTIADAPPAPRFKRHGSSAGEQTSAAQVAPSDAFSAGSDYGDNNDDQAAPVSAPRFKRRGSDSAGSTAEAPDSTFSDSFADAQTTPAPRFRRRGN